jgi:Mn2+/Fe2+ NRAMP family transporter
MPADNYIITEKTIKEPPTSFLQRLRFLGPGFILSASIVGSGELIATTTLGARAGFVAFWIIIASCLVKVAVQLEFGKHAILNGETAMKAFNLLPGFRIGNGRWAVWSVFLLTTMKIVQIGGILGGTAIVLNMLYSGFSIAAWAVISVIVTALLIFKGYYNVVEKSSLVMIVGFTVLTVASLVAVNYTAFAITWSDIASGFEFKLPAALVGVAFGAFGITGVASDEIIAYNYWCLEKGYAAYTGPRTNDEAWQRRANGWIKVMYLDATVAMIVYTTVTAAFYLLGASVLHKQGLVPEGNQVIETLASIYTHSLGPGIKTAYLVGAFFVLYSSLFASLAAWTRLYSDIFGQLGWMNFFDVAKRKKVIAWLAFIFPFLYLCMYLFINAPVLMILSGGIVGSILLFIVVYAALHFRYKRNAFFKPGFFYDAIFWTSVISIILVGVFGIAKVFNL